MKKFYLLVIASIMMLLSACHDKIWDAIDDLDARVARLEELCKEMNTNIVSLQTLVSVIQENDFITTITPIEKGGEVIGYTITFDKHAPITIYNGIDGKDGVDGTNGVNGEDGYTPILGVAKDTDGVYYWTLDGEWLLDAEGNKLPVSGKNGDDGTDGENGGNNSSGQNGQDGKPGADGKDGKDGITPQLKIEEGYWYVSYDNGATWTELGKAIGEDGEKGDKGDKGDTGNDGDSMFTSVTYDENNVYFTLTDGSVLIVPRGNSAGDFDQTVIDNLVTSLTLNKEYIYLENIGDKDTLIAVTAPFANSKVMWMSNDTMIVRVTDGVVEAISRGSAKVIVEAGFISKEVNVFVGVSDDFLSGYFSVSSTKKVRFSKGNLQYQASTGIWRFAENQYDVIGVNNQYIDTLYEGWIDLFGAGTAKNPCLSTTQQEDYKELLDWGVYNPIQNGGNEVGLWRTLTFAEWKYLLNGRDYAGSLKGVARIGGLYTGLIILPDRCNVPSILNFKGGVAFVTDIINNKFGSEFYCLVNDYTLEQWKILENLGAIFLPAAGIRFGKVVNGTGDNGYYWSSSNYALEFTSGYINVESTNSISSQLVYNGCSVRLVQDIDEE